ncbi:MAG: hypothetical protein GY725_16480 [bacterium]|nr:hypothetical protein [bacterium]
MATLNGNPITLQELDAFASPTNREAYQGLYDARRGALEQLINERLIESAAAQEGVTSDEFFERKIEAHVAPVTGAEVRTFYDANFKPGEGREFEDVAGRIEAFLLRNRVVERRDEILAGLSAKAKLEISLDPPRADVPVSPTEPAIGPVTAAVTIVEYSDFQ